MDLRHAHLEGAHLTGADLRGAHLEGAHLTGADLNSASLQAANLTHADLTDANLVAADLASVRGMTPIQLRAARSIDEATLPDYLAEG